MNQRDSDVFQVMVGVPENNWYDGSIPETHKVIEEKVQELFGQEIKVNKSIIGRGAAGFGFEIDLIKTLSDINNIAVLISFLYNIKSLLSWLKDKSKRNNHGSVIINTGLIKLLCIGHVQSTEDISSELEIISFEELAGNGSNGPNYEGYDFYSCMILHGRGSKEPKLYCIIANSSGDILGMNKIVINEFNGYYSKSAMFRI